MIFIEYYTRDFLVSIYSSTSSIIFYQTKIRTDITKALMTKGAEEEWSREEEELSLLVYVL